MKWQKSVLLDMVYLQQDAFDEVDSSMSRERQVDGPEPLGPVPHVEARAPVVSLRIRRHQVRLGREPIGGGPPGQLGKDRLDARVVQTEDRETPEGNPVGEGHERLLNRRKASVVIEVLRLDIGDHRDHRSQAQEGAVALVRLGHQKVSGAELGAGAVLARAQNPAADDGRGVETRFVENVSDERGRGRLAVSARHGDAVLEPHHFGEHLCARNHRNALILRLADLRVAGADGRGDDHHVSAFYVPGIVALGHLDSQ